MVAIERVRADSFHPRLSMELARFEALRQSLAEMGMIQPILLRDMGKSSDYVLISGHRRLLAARQLAWREVPARILKVTAERAHAIRTAENLHREELAPLDRAEAFERYFLLEGKRTRAELAAALGIDARELAALLALLEAAPAERERIIYGIGPAGAAPVARVETPVAEEGASALERALAELQSEHALVAAGRSP